MDDLNALRQWFRLHARTLVQVRFRSMRILRPAAHSQFAIASPGYIPSKIRQLPALTPGGVAAFKRRMLLIDVHERSERDKSSRDPDPM